MLTPLNLAGTGCGHYRPAEVCRRLRATVLKCVLTIVIPVIFTPAYALPNAVFDENANCGAGNSVSGSQSNIPESVSVDLTTASGSCVATVLTSPIGPQLDIQINATGGLIAGGTASILYALVIERRVEDAPAVPVSITVRVAASASILGAPAQEEGGQGSAGASFEIGIPDPLGSEYFRSFSGSVTRLNCVEFPDDEACINPMPSSVDISQTFVYMLPPNEELFVAKSGSAIVSLPGNSVGAQVVADPIFLITPGAMVDYNGVETLASDLYTIRYSPLIGQQPVDIDIQPFDAANEVQPSSNNPIVVAVHSTNVADGDAYDFDATQVDPATLKFGVGEASNVAVTPWVQDLDGDSDSDVMFAFRTQDTGIFCGDTEAELTGETYGAVAFFGIDSLMTTDCVDTGCHP